MSDQTVLTNESTDMPQAPIEPVSSEPSSPETSDLGAISAGLLLKQARDAAGIHLATLSMALKVPIKKLEALEADDWAKLPDPVFVRALATSVCRQIKIDSLPVLAALPAATSVRLADDRASRGLNQSFRAPSDPKPSLFKFSVSLPMVLAAIVLLMAAIVIIFLPDVHKKNDVKTKDTSEVVETLAAPPQVVAASVVGVTAPNPAVSNAASVPPLASASLSASQTTVVAAQASPSAPLAATISAASTTSMATSAPAAPSPTAAQNTPTLRLVAKGVVWIEVKDVKGALLVQRTMQPKEVVNVNGAAPLAVVIGRINEMQSVEVRGKSFSLAGLSPDNVARFEIK